FFFFSSRRRHTRSKRDWSSDVCSSDLFHEQVRAAGQHRQLGAVLEEWEPYAGLLLQHKPAELAVLPGGTHLLVKPWERLASSEKIGRASCRERGELYGVGGVR